MALSFAVLAQPAGRQLLNSERITERFGNYGIEVLESDATVRVSNLFSAVGEGAVCRTFAVVRYPDSVDPALGTEHAVILRGGSIGAVFAAAGWEVRKTHLYFGDLPAPPRVAALMNVAVGTSVAEHVYVLDVAKDGQVIEYAALVEIHHPEYLRSSDLPRIYGPANSAGRGALIAALLATALERGQR